MFELQTLLDVHLVPWQNSGCCIMKLCAPAPCPDQCVLRALPGSQQSGRVSHNHEKCHELPVTDFFCTKNILKHTETMWPTTLQVDLLHAISVCPFCASVDLKDEKEENKQFMWAPCMFMSLHLSLSYCILASISV